MAQPAVQQSQGFHVRPGRWTAQRALAELPETTEMTIEVIDGSIVVTPRPESLHAGALRDLAYLMHRAAKPVGLRALPEINLVIGEELTSPDITVVRDDGQRRVWFDGGDAPVMLLHELVDGEYRPVSVAAAGTTFTMHEPFEFAIDPAELLDS